MRKLESFDWWEDIVRLKDELSLRELGEKFGVTPGAITSALKRNGLTRQPAPPGPRALRKRSTSHLPPEPGEALAKKAAPKKAAPKKAAPKKSASKLADLPVSKNARRTPQRRRKSRIDPFAHLVGEVADRIVAEHANVTINAVRNYRVVRGITAAGRRGRQTEAVVEAPAVAVVAEVASPAPVATAPVAAPVAGSGAQQAYQVTLDDGRTGIVVGVTLVAAATRAESAGTVSSLTLLGPVF